MTVSLKGGDRIAARLVIGADGRRSLCRTAAGIESDGRAYPQTALTFNLAHTRPHHDTSTEFHTESGPFTLVPLPGERSSLVCVVEPAEAERIAALDDVALNDEIEQRSHSILGKITVEPGRGVFPLAVETVRTFGAEPHRARRRSRPSHPADRRAGPQSRPPRRRLHRRARGVGRAAMAATSARRICWRATTRSAAPM